MIFEFYRRYLLPASILSGTIIGAGVFALPYVFVRAGWVTGVAYLFLLTVAVWIIHSMFAEVILHVGEGHRFVGYVRILLGGAPFRIALITSVLGLILTLTAYLVLGISFINLLYPQGSELVKVIIFWLLGSLLVLVRIRLLALLEFLVVIGLLFIIAFIFILGLGGWHKFGSLSTISPGYLFSPFGPILFSLIGRTAIPSVINYISDAGLPSFLVKRAILLGTVIPPLFYLAFIVGIIGLSNNVSIDSVSGLIATAPRSVLFIVGIFGLLSLLSTYIVLGIDVSKNLILDLRLPKAASLTAVIALPMVFYLFGLKNFLGLASIIGGVFISLEAAMIALMWKKIGAATSKRALIAYVLAGIFLLGAFYEIITTVM